MSNITTTLNTIQQQFQNDPWFYGAEVDLYGRIVVFVHSMDATVMKTVPEQIDGIRVLLSYAATKTFKREQFVATPQLFHTPEVIHTMVETNEEEEEMELPSLSEELIRLERICGLNVLQSIFYEIHDGKNAFTNMSSKYPNVRMDLEWLYNTFGFDLLYEAFNR